MTPVTTLATLLEAFFNIFCRHTHTCLHRHKGIAFPLLCMRTRGNEHSYKQQEVLAPEVFSSCNDWGERKIAFVDQQKSLF